MKNILQWYGVGLSDIGLVRQTNQDAMLIANPTGLWAVADGMGGRAGGDVAAQVAIHTIGKFFDDRTENAALAPAASGQERTEALLSEAITEANRAIRKEIQRHPKLAGMGTTVVVLRIIPGSPALATIGHAGDSRAYLFRGGELRRLTRDHSAVEEYLRRGLITAEQAANHPHKHILSRALGVDEQVEPDLATHPLEQDDLLLLCSDGLNKMIKDPSLETLLREGETRPEIICRRLVETSNRLGGEDNVTVLIVKAVPV